MAVNVILPPSSLSLWHTKKLIYSTQIRLRIMSSASKSQPQSVASSAVYQVPGLDSHEMDSTADKTFERYSSNTAKRNGKGVSIVWFRNDLRVLDNEPLFKAWVSSQAVLPVYCIDPRLFQTTYYFGFPKTGGITLLPAFWVVVACFPSWILSFDLKYLLTININLALTANHSFSLVAQPNMKQFS